MPPTSCTICDDQLSSKNNNKQSGSNNITSTDSFTNKLRNLQPYLQIGDFIPFININGVVLDKQLHTYGTFKDFIIITHNDMNVIYNIQHILYTMRTSHNLITVSKNAMSNISGLDKGILYTVDEQLNKLLHVSESLLFYIVSPTRQIKKILSFPQFKNIIRSKLPLYENVVQTIPYILVEDALNHSLYHKLINYFREKKPISTITSSNNKLCFKW